MSDDEVVFGPGPSRLLVDGRDVAPLAVADSPNSRRRGLLGTDRLDGALWITRCPSVHMVGMRYAIDVAVLDRAGSVLLVRTLRPWWGLTVPRWAARTTVEMPAGAAARWGIRRGAALRVG